MKCLILLCLAVYCVAQVPTTCPGPKQFEARRIATDRSKQFQEISKFSYDEINRRTRSIEEIQQGTERDFYDVLHLYNVNKEYRLNLKTRKCNVTDLNRPLRPVGVPPGSHFVYTAEVGAAELPNEHMTVEIWDGTFEDGTKFLMTIAAPDCVPVSRNFYNADMGLVTETYFDLNLGITDPAAFIPPTECN